MRPTCESPLVYSVSRFAHSNLPRNEAPVLSLEEPTSKNSTLNSLPQ